MSSARLQLSSYIQDKKNPPKISLKRASATSFYFEIQIWVTGEDTPANQPIPNPAADSARDIYLSPTPLYIGEPSLILVSPSGQNTSTLTITSTIDGKIPGTPDLMSK